jgi:ribosomal protein S20
MVTDVDFCVDFHATPADLIQVNTRIQQLVTPENHKFIHNNFRRQDNVGLQFRERRNATPAKPFVKTYHKTLELKYHSHEFAEAYLKGHDYEDLARLETNLKNSAFKKHHQLQTKTKTFRQLMELDQKSKEKVMFSALPSYLEKATTAHITSDIPPMDRYIIFLFNQLMKKGYGKSAFYAGLDIFDDKQQRHRMRNKLKKLFKEIDDQETLNSNTRIDDIFKQLKILQ